MNKGVVIVAAISRAYYRSAVRLAASIHDYAPGTKITLFTHASYIRDADRHLFDNVVVGIPTHIRAKLWALPKTPYDLTLYLDADMEVVDDEFEKVFDLIGAKDKLAFTEIRPHVSKDTHITDTDKLVYHGGIFLYRKCKVIDEWYKEYLIQAHSPEWPYKQEGYSEKMKPWDQFTLWRLLKKHNTKVKRLGGEEDYRWNYIHLYELNGIDNSGEVGKDPIIMHYTLPSTQVELEKTFQNNPDLFD